MSGYRCRNVGLLGRCVEVGRYGGLCFTHACMAQDYKMRQDDTSYLTDKMNNIISLYNEQNKELQKIIHENEEFKKENEKLKETLKKIDDVVRGVTPS
jgi:hypothetical protein